MNKELAEKFYETAKKLYDAGFPNMKCSEENPEPGYTYPNLPELIDACGNKFLQLYLWREKEEGKYVFKGWRAYPFPVTDKPDGYEGETKEEAVANLWLELNKK